MWIRHVVLRMLLVLVLAVELSMIKYERRVSLARMVVVRAAAAAAAGAAEAAEEAEAADGVVTVTAVVGVT